MDLQKKLEELEALLSDPAVRLAGSATFEGRRVTYSQLVAMREQTKSSIEINRKGKPTSVADANRTNRILAAEKKLATAEQVLSNRANKGKDVAKELEILNDRVTELTALDPQNSKLQKYLKPAVAETAPDPFSLPGPRLSEIRTTPQTTTGATTGGTGAGTGTGGTGTGTGAGGTGAGKKTKGGKKAVTADQLAEAVQAFFPNYSAEWLSENGVQHFGQDLINLFRRVAAPGSTFDLSTEAGRERIRAEIRKTVYWQTTLTAAKNFDQLGQVDQVNTLERTKQRLASTYGDLQLDDVTLTELARNVARNGLSGLGEQQAVYNTVFRLQQERPAQARRALEGTEADGIRRLARAYNYRVSDEQIQSILTGTPEATTGLVLTTDGLRERMQKAVKGAMPQLAEQIDAGLTLEDIGFNYRRYAANLLEKSEDQIDMFSGPYLDAFGNREGGQLSLGEWSQKVKSDPRFGYQFTNQANVLAGDIALTIARAFGKVR